MGSPAAKTKSLEVPIIDGNTTAYSGGDTCETHRDEDFSLPLTSSGIASYEIEGNNNNLNLNNKQSPMSPEIIYVRPAVVSRSLPASAYALSAAKLITAAQPSLAVQSEQQSCHEQQPSATASQASNGGKGPLRRLFNKFATCCNQCSSGLCHIHFDTRYNQFFNLILI